MTLGTGELRDMVRVLREISGRAADLLVEQLHQPRDIEYKGEVDLVTDVDTRAEELITRHLKKNFPDCTLVAEESGLHKEGSPTRIYIDPIDGTTNYAHKHPAFAVSIGVEHEGALIAGVIRAPMLGLDMWSYRGGGVWDDDVRCRVSNTDCLDRALITTGFPYDRRSVDDDNTAELRAVMKRAQGIRRCGSAAVDLCLVAKGVYDGFWECRLKPWDVAAGALFVAEAGGVVTDYFEGDLNLSAPWILATNGRIHAELSGLLARARAARRHGDELA